MHFKKYIIALFLVLSLFGTTFVYSNFYKSEFVSGAKLYSKTLYLDQDVLSKTYVSYEAKQNISKYSLVGNCEFSSKFEKKLSENEYLFSLELLGKKCENNTFFLQDELSQRLINTGFRFEIKSYFQLFNQFGDVETGSLQKAFSKLEAYEKKLQNFKKLETIDTRENFKKYFQYHEIVFQKNILEEMLSQRKEKYLIPVSGHLLPTKETKLPNSGRPYRADYTYGIHEGWDIDAKLGENISSIDNGVIVRIVDEFQFDNLDALIKKEKLSHNERTQNLDILRGNQVWLKTSKGDLVFYSHLQSVDPDLYEGMRVTRGQKLGTIGISGVPDKNYTDYHLHFELRKNPYDLKMAGKYTFQDYMNWDWYFKGKSASYIKQEQYKIFEK